MGTELVDNQEMIFICEFVVQNPPNGTIVTFQRQVDINGDVTSTQTASIEGTSTKNFNLVLGSGTYTTTGTDVGIGLPYIMLVESGSYSVTGTDVTLTYP